MLESEITAMANWAKMDHPDFFETAAGHTNFFETAGQVLGQVMHE